MKKNITLLLISLFFISCNSNNNQLLFSPFLTDFTEPFYEPGATEEDIQSVLGTDFYGVPHSSGFEFGYAMRYEAEEDGVEYYYFGLDNDHLLHETFVSFYFNDENINFLTDFLNTNYTFVSESTTDGITSVFYSSNTSMTLELRYSDTTFSGIFLFYRN